MGAGLSATPFGRRALSLAMVAGDLAARECPPGRSVDKWKVFRALCEAKVAIGVTDRALAVLAALLSFHPDQEMSSNEGLIVFPSNAQLALRAHGMAPATLRRHLAVLVDCGVLIRRDSPNGKRYARKGEGGAIAQAYGFDLKPLVVRAEEFERHAEAVRKERQALQLLRERITLLRRDLAKMIVLAMEEGIPGDWKSLNAEFRAIVSTIPRTASRVELEPIGKELGRLGMEARNLLEAHVNSQELSANESQSERHIQNSKPQSYESESGFRESHEATEAPRPQPSSNAPAGYPLGLVLRACPDIADYAREGISGWSDLVATANLVRGALGVTTDAWDQARHGMGAVDAAIVVAAMLQRGEKITNPGGYLRSLTDKAREGTFSVGPMLMALLRTNGQAEPTARTG